MRRRERSPLRLTLLSFRDRIPLVFASADIGVSIIILIPLEVGGEELWMGWDVEGASNMDIHSSLRS